MSRNRSLEEIQEDIRTLTRVPSEFIHAKLDELAEEIGELAKPKWIPCSERIPEEPKENLVFDGKCLEVYLVTTKYGSSDQDKVYPFRAFWNGINFTDGWGILDVIAWMPLPEPYKEEEEMTKEETVAAIEMGIHALKETQWIPISERLPEDESYILVSFKNSTMPDIARYEENGGGGTFYPGDDEKPYSSYGIFVNAWMPLPKLYREEEWL